MTRLLNLNNVETWNCAYFCVVNSTNVSMFSIMNNVNTWVFTHLRYHTCTYMHAHMCLHAYTHTHILTHADWIGGIPNSYMVLWKWPWAFQHLDPGLKQQYMILYQWDTKQLFFITTLKLTRTTIMLWTTTAFKECFTVGPNSGIAEAKFFHEIDNCLLEKQIMLQVSNTCDINVVTL